MKGKLLSFGLLSAWLVLSGCQQEVKIYQASYDPVPVEELYGLAGDLILHRTEVPDSQNGYFMAFDAFEKFEVQFEPGDLTSSRFLSRDAEVESGRLNFDQTLEMVRKSLDLEAWQEPIPEDSLDISFPSYAQAKQFCKVAVFHAEEAFAKGDSGEGTDLLLAVWNLARAYSEGATTETSYMVALACESICVEGLERALVSGQMRESDIERFAKEASFFDGMDPVWIKMARVNLTEKLLPRIATISIGELASLMTLGDDDASNHFRMVFTGLTFDRKATAEAAIDQVRKIEAAYTKPEFMEVALESDGSGLVDQLVDEADEKRLKEDVGYLNEYRARIEATGNPVGQLVLVVSGYPTVDLSKVVRNSTARHRMVKIGLAARLAGSRGETVKLDELGLPSGELIDPFSGETLGFDLQRKLVWSVGEDRIDDGGIGLHSVGEDRKGDRTLRWGP